MPAPPQVLDKVFIQADGTVTAVIFPGKLYGGNDLVLMITGDQEVTLPEAGAGGGAVSSVFGRTGAVVAAANDYSFAQLSGKPTTLSGYGITDAQPLDTDLTAIAALTTTAFGRGALTQADAPTFRTYIGAGTSNFSGNYTDLNFTGSNLTSLATRNFADLQAKPTTLSGYGITDAVSLSGSYADPSWITSLAWTKITGAPSFEPALGNPPADNYLLASTAAGVRSWVPPGGTGTVTSFSADDLPPLFTTTEANPTTTPALSFALSAAGAHTFLGNNTGSSAAPSYVQPAFTDLSGVASTAQGGLPIGGSAGQALVKTGGANYAASWASATSSYQAFQSAALNPGGVSSATAVMAGFGGAAGLNPQVTGRVLVIFSGGMTGNAVNTAMQATMRWGTGAAPANGAAPVGNGFGGVQSCNFPIAGGFMPFCLAGIITGLALGTTIWVDLTQRNYGAGGTVNFSNVTVSLHEF